MSWPAGLDEAAAGARLLIGLPRHLRQRLVPEQARAVVRQRLERREEDFLDVARRAIYQQPSSPYRRLLEHAGCELQDLARLVRQDGLEGALRALYREGVYLTVEELKGREVRRGSLHLTARLDLLRNPLGVAHVRVSSSGSKGPSMAGLVNLMSIRDQAVDQCVMLAARGGLDWRHGHWGVPGGEATARLLEHGLYGRGPFARFTQVDPASPGLHPRYRWNERALRLGSFLAGRPFEPLEVATLGDPLPIARWIESVRRTGQTPHLWSFSSPAVRLALASSRAGVDLSGVYMSLTGEATTPARLATLRRSGASALAWFGSTEAGLIAFGCLAGDGADDSHLLADLHALVLAPSDQPGQPMGTLLSTAIRPSARFVLLNASLGDRAEIGESRCGCAFERIGWTTRLRTIRSVQKLTAGGVTFLDSDAVRALEETLPARFGGAPTDYQLLEQEREDGRPALRLLINPTVGALDPDQVGEAFLSALGGSSGAERVAALQWRQGGWLQVERRPPLVTATGKIHAIRRDDPERTGASEGSPPDTPALGSRAGRGGRT